ncbi:MAG: hypothetical protein U1F43_31845 [Myxococcota bacterium]
MVRAREARKTLELDAGAAHPRRQPDRGLNQAVADIAFYRDAEGRHRARRVRRDICFFEKNGLLAVR